MPLWGRNDQAVTANSTTTKETSNGAPIGTYTAVKSGGGATAHYGNTSGSRANTDVNMFNNVTSSSFITNMAVGVFGVSATEMANNTLNNSKEHGAHAGWNLRRAGTGPVTSFTITDSGSGFANGETIVVSNGSSNATGTVTTNATANMTSVAVTTGGAGFTNTAMATIAFNREKHVSQIKDANASTLGYSNTYYVVVSNGTVNAVANVTTNATGGSLSFTFTNPGLFSNTFANTNAVVSVINSTGGVVTGNAVLSANLSPSTGGTVTITLGGRAGRIHHETLVAMGSLGAQTAAYGTAALAGDASSDDTLFPGV